jgi:hypothetical protein
MNHQLRINTLIVALIFIFSGCAFGGGGVHAAQELGPPLLRLTSAVEGVCERPDVYGFPLGGSGEELIRLAVGDDPSLLVPFDGLVVKAKCEKNHGIVLVCDSEGKMTLMEDAGCTIKIDHRAEEPVRACEFSIHIEAVCK